MIQSIFAHQIIVRGRFLTSKFCWLHLQRVLNVIRYYILTDLAPVHFAATALHPEMKFRYFEKSAKKKCASGELRPRPDARCQPGSPRTPGASEFSIHCPLASTALQHPTFLLLSLRIRLQSAPPPDVIHLLPSLLPAPNDLPFLLFSLRIRPQSASPDTIHLPPYRFSCTP